MALESSPGEEGSPLVLLHKCGSNDEASVLRGLLGAEGIFCFVQGEQHRSMLGAFGPYIEPGVMVREADLDRAREVISGFEDRLATAQSSIGEQPRPRARRDVKANSPPTRT